LSRFLHGIGATLARFEGGVSPADYSPASRKAHLSIPVLDEPKNFIRRTLAGAIAVGAAGTVVLFAFGHPGWAVGFALGVTISLGNLHLITRAVARVTDLEAKRAPGHLWKGALFRFGIVAAVLFTAVAVFHVNVLALIAGLLLTQLVMIVFWIAHSLRATT
jgi:hypothetical protein